MRIPVWLVVVQIVFDVVVLGSAIVAASLYLGAIKGGEDEVYKDVPDSGRGKDRR